MNAEHPLIAYLLQCLQNLAELPVWLSDGGKRFFWFYLLACVALGYLSYRRYHGGRGGFLRFLLPRSVYTHPSAKLDYQLFLANRAFMPGGVLSGWLLGGLGIATVADGTEGLLHRLFGMSPEPVDWTWPALLAFTVSLALISDLSTYLVHALHHRVPWLWEFHKVHHSAEVLTPVTLYRKHPVYTVLSRVMDIAVIGPLQGVVAFCFPGDADTITLFGANFVFAVFNTLGSNLRHSHVWISYGQSLSHVLISPAQHQIHHSKAPRHWDKNYGEAFALWDWAFGTLYVPREREVIEFGLAGAATQEHPNLASAYLVPFRNVMRLARARFRPSPRRLSG
jgi:sterol desaturase/sphingolipid hydroxylase (fatty acid hydroxylase superfamily)